MQDYLFVVVCLQGHTETCTNNSLTFEFTKYKWANYPSVRGHRAQGISPTRPFGLNRFEVRRYGSLRDREVAEEFDRATGYVRPFHVDHVGPTGIPPYRPARRRSRSVIPSSWSPSPRITTPPPSTPRVSVSRPQGPVVHQLSFTEPPPPASPPPVVDEGAAVAVGGVGVGAAVADVGVVRAANPSPVAANPSTCR